METTTQSTDRLRALSDDVICHILSFLPTKLSVSTSILATRWRFLWTHVPNLDLDFGYEEHFRKGGITFPFIINRILLLRKVQSLNTFRLILNSFSHSRENCFRDYEVATWITYIISCNAREIDICFHRHQMLPKCLFTCKNIVDLTLENCKGIPSSDVVSLPNLKKLALCNFAYGSDEALTHLLSGCPVLEELEIYGLEDENMSCFAISSPTIKSLTVKNGFYCILVTINAPALEYILVDDCWYMEIICCPLNSLIEADICLDEYVVKEYNKNNICAFDILHSLCNVKCLKLSGCCGKFIDESSDPIIKFHNLTKLELAADCPFLAKFLECADNLEVLIIRKVDKEMKISMETNEQLPASLYSLRTIRIEEFECAQHEFNTVEYLLRNAKVLERMEIYSKLDGNNLTAKFDAHQRISLLERGSKECELTFN